VAARPGLPHYTISIVRGQGVVGRTGKGAITRELGQTPAEAGLAVLADPAACAPVAGTREDLLVPNACLNATVSGLVSRTVVVPGLIGPDDFHGATFYRGLTGEDVSGQFLDAVLLLARHLRVPVERRADLGPYTTVGLMRPPGL
jgi:Phosphoribosyl transferase (PRTase)